MGEYSSNRSNRSSFSRGSSRGFNRSPSRGGYRGGRPQGRSRMARENINENKYVKKAELVEIKPHIPEWGYTDLKVDNVLKRNVLKKGYLNPTPIQEKAIPEILNKKDFLGLANTGTGKTAAFLIPLLQKIIDDRKCKILIIVPTRELANQINEEVYSLTRDLRVFSVQCIGGANITNQIYNLRRGFNFVIGTPGRLEDLIERKVLNLSEFNTIVLDEVDRMLDMGFVDEIKKIISHLPSHRQSLFFSATMSEKIEGIMKLILKPDYVKVSVVTGETSKNIDQDIIRVDSKVDKNNKLKELLSKPEFSRVLIFVSTKRGVDALDNYLYENGFKVGSIHGDKRQRDREKSIMAFKKGMINILVATDVAARGLDISNVSHVINYDEPPTYQDYIHRIGRTGRADKKGVALTFIEKKEIKPLIRMRRY